MQNHSKLADRPSADPAPPRSASMIAATISPPITWPAMYRIPRNVPLDSSRAIRCILKQLQEQGANISRHLGFSHEDRVGMSSSISYNKLEARNCAGSAPSPDGFFSSPR